MAIEPWALKQRQSLPMEAKVVFSRKRIREFYEATEGLCYVSVSGKDSLVVLDIARSLYPNIPVVFVNTKLEFPEIVSFWAKKENVETIYPDYSFKQVLEQYGYPVVSKKVSMGISRYRNTKDDYQKHLRLHGGTNPTSGRAQARTIPIKYHHYVDAPFKISDECCNRIKKDPLKKYHKRTGLSPITGEMASDSQMRGQTYLQHGCNMTDRAIPKSTPLGIWMEQDSREYIKTRKLEYPSVYDMGYARTGCMFCMFGLQMEMKTSGKHRFEIMAKTHPRQYEYCMDKLGIREVLKFMRIECP